MNPFMLSVNELEKRARSVRRRIIQLNAGSPAGGAHRRGPVAG